MENGVRISNAVNFDTWQTVEGEMPSRNNHEIQCNQQWEPNIILPHHKTLNNQQTTIKCCAGDHIVSSRSEQEAATTIQAIYRGYKTRSKLNNIKKISSEDNQKTKKIAELLSTTNCNNNRHNNTEAIRISTSLSTQGLKKSGGLNAKHGSPRKRRQNFEKLENFSQLNSEIPRVSLNDFFFFPLTNCYLLLPITSVRCCDTTTNILYAKNSKLDEYIHRKQDDKSSRTNPDNQTTNSFVQFRR